MKNITMVCYGGGHVRIIEPLYSELHKNYNITIFALTSARKYLDDKKIEYISFLDFDYLMTDRAYYLGQSAIKDMCIELCDIDESIIYMGLNLLELENKYGSKKAADIYKEKGRSCFLPLTVINELFNKTKPDLIITTNSPRAERASLIIAKERNIPSICIADNIWIHGGIIDVAKCDLSDYICVVSKSLKNEILKVSDYDCHRIFVTGTPVYDKLKKLYSKKGHNKSSSCKKILLADCDLPSFDPRFPSLSGDSKVINDIRKELNELAKINDWNVIFRPHPSQKVDYSNYENIIISNPKDNLHDLLLEIDVVITATSTVGLEGKLLGCGLVSLENTVYNEIASYDRLGLSTGVYHTYELNNAIKNEINKSDERLELYSGYSLVNIKSLISKVFGSNI